MPIRKLLVANRGEIAVRVFRTCRRLGIVTVAVYSEADRHAVHMQAADQAVCIGPAPARESYLSIDALLAAAAATDADAIHPGYGFLSENAAFAAAVIGAGLTWIGPAPEAIRRLGSKIEAKKLARSAGVPTVPGYWPEEGPGDSARLAREAARIGFPILIKAAAGGGGKGMRVVRAAAEFEPALEGAQREALSAFGDPTVFIEQYIERPRHIEIQVIGDAHGTVLHLGERECSVQRRHQKVIEESPSPAPQMTAARRAEMGAHAVALARAAGYTNAGTVEFIMDAAGRHYFLEVNTRLQVEHPVTELVTGIDLVEWQIRVAEGASLPLAQAEIAEHGHAVEARVYAEDATQSFLPAVGRITRWAPGPITRLDSGVAAGSTVGIHYDALLAKLIAYGPTRAAAVEELARALALSVVDGVTTNLGFLLWVVQHPEFRAGHIDTGFLDRQWHPDGVSSPPPDLVPEAAAAMELAAAPAVTGDLWRRTPSPLTAQEMALTYDYVPAGLNPGQPGTRPLTVMARRDPAQPATWHLRASQRDTPVALAPSSDGAVRLGLPGAGGMEWLAVPVIGRASAAAGEVLVFAWGDRLYRLVRPRPLSTDTLAAPPHLPSENHLHAPMPGKIIQVLVMPDQKVVEGERLVVMEAMKMEFTIRAPHGGYVRALLVREGQLVEAGTVLVDLE